MDVYDYFQQRERDFAKYSLVPDRPFSQMVAEEGGSGAKRGRIIANLVMTDRAFLKMHEVVVVLNDHVTREEYAYYLIIDGDEIWGEERDTTHEPAVHRHVDGHLRVPCDSITFKAAVKKAWADVSAFEAESGEES